MFEYLLQKRVALYKAHSLKYALIARVLRDGGLAVAVLARDSLISQSCTHPFGSVAMPADALCSADGAVRGVRRRRGDVHHRVHPCAPKPTDQRLSRL
jgi:hypothetical protein